MKGHRPMMRHLARRAALGTALVLTALVLTALGGSGAVVPTGTAAHWLGVALVGTSGAQAPAALTGGQQLRSPSGQYAALVQGDGNVVVYGNGRPLWATGTAGAPGALLAVQTDGNVVLYDREGRPRWVSGTAGTGSDTTLTMQDDGNLVLYGARGALWATGAPASNTLTAPSSLSAGQFLHSASGRYRAVLGMDGDFVLFDGGTALWSSGTRGLGSTRLIVQGDGNAVVYDANGAPRWSSQTAGTGRSNELVLRDDGTLLVRAAVGTILVGSRYLIPTTHLATVAGGCQVLHGQTPGEPVDLTAGVKVAMVQGRLGFPQAHPTWMDSDTVTAVTRFQQAHGLPTTGRVELTTWQALGLSSDSWCVDRYETPPAVPLWATTQRRIDAEIGFAESYVGGRYVYGGAGTRAQGVDCSGLVQQALFHAGLDIQPLPQAPNGNNHDTSSYSVYADQRLRHVPVGQRQPGDLVFFTAGNVVEHVAIYTGSELMVNALNIRSGVSDTPFTTSLAGMAVMPTVVRPFG